MIYVLFAVLALALVVSVIALAREMRLRKALEKLLRIILSRWRAHDKNPIPKHSFCPNSDRGDRS